MLTGVVDKNSFSALLQGIASKRKHGELSITFSDRNVSIGFVAGRIATFSIGEENLAMKLFIRLSDAGLISPGAEFRGSTIEELKAELPKLAVAGRGPLDIYLRRAVRKNLIDTLLGFHLTQTGTWQFRVGSVSSERDTVASVSVNQFLLMQSEVKVLAERYGAAVNSDLAFRVDRGAPGISEEEGVVLESLVDGTLPSQLEERALLSSYHLHEAVLGLLDRGVISQPSLSNPSGQVQAPAQEIEELGESLDESLESEIVEPEFLSTAPAESAVPDRVSRAMSLGVLFGSLLLALLLWDRVLGMF